MAIPGWLGLAAALRLKQAAPGASVSATDDAKADRPISSSARVWLRQLDIWPRDNEVGGDTLRLLVTRNGETIDCGAGDLVSVDARLYSVLRDRLRKAGVSAAATLPDGALIVGRASPFRRATATHSGGELRMVFGAAEAHLRTYPGHVELLWPENSRPDAGALLRQVGLEGTALVEDQVPSPDFDIGLSDDMLCLGGGEQEPALIEQLAGALNEADPVSAFASRRQKVAAASQHGVRNRLDWFARPQRNSGLGLSQFAYSLLSASQRVGHEEMARQYPTLVSDVEAAIANAAGANGTAPPMFAPFRLRGTIFANRIVLSPMCMYSAEDGLVGDFHLVHLGARALGGAGLILTEMTAVSPEGRITPGCAGLYEDRHVDAWRRIVRFVHGASPAKIGLQLGHAGPKASTQLGWQRMDEPLPEGNWPIVAASEIAYGPRNQTPKAMTPADMDALQAQYVAAASRAGLCGFDTIELHFAHGYLLSSFISPLTNRREDEFGGTIAARARLAERILGAVRSIWEKPLSVRISACDWAEGGLSAEDAVALARILKEAGADAITVSTGQTTRGARPLYGRMYQVPFADLIRNEVGIPTIAVGAITEADQVNSIVAAGRADLCALARPHLADAAWTLRAAVEQGFAGQWWPKQYLAGRAQAERESGRKPMRGAV